MDRMKGMMLMCEGGLCIKGRQIYIEYLKGVKGFLIIANGFLTF